MSENIQNLKQKTINGLIWRFLERVMAQLITLVVSIVLARILLPNDYGIVAIVQIFINLADALVTSGLGTSLVQKKEATEEDFSTMFCASLVFSLLMYILIFFSAPIVAKIYNNDLLIIVLRIMGLKIPIAAINSIQQAYVQRRMIYKKFFFATIIGTIISAFVGILMAINNFGVWALVAQYLTNSVIDTIVLSITIKWKPKFYFSYKSFKPLFNYGSKIMLANFIGTLFDQLRGLLIGVKYTSEDLAYNNKGEQIPTMLSSNINSTVDSVLFSSISKVQDDPVKVKTAVRMLMKTSSFIIMPIMFGLLAVSNTFVRIILTDKWISCVPFMQIVCVQQCFSILSTINLQAIKAIGKSDIILKLESIKKPIYMFILICAMQISPIAICFGSAIYSIVGLVINIRPNKRYINYSLKEQISDVFIYLFISICMSIVVGIIGIVGNINIYLVFTLQILCGIIFYVVVSAIFKLDSYVYLLNTIKKFILKGEKNVISED